MLQPAQIVDKFVIAVPVCIGLVVLHGCCMNIQRLIGRGDQRFDLVVNYVVVDVLAVGGGRNGEVILEDHGVKIELSIDPLTAVKAALERMDIRRGITPALIVRRHSGLLPGEQHTLRHIGVIQRLYRQTEQQLKFCPDGIAGIGRHDQCTLCSHRSGSVQSGIVGVQVGVAQLCQLIGKCTEIRKGFRHDLYHIGLYAVIEVQIRHFL